MGRAGAGGGHSSGGGHSHSRSSGGHNVGSSRARGSFSSGSHHSRGYHSSNSYNHDYTPGLDRYRYGSVGGVTKTQGSAIAVVFIIILILLNIVRLIYRDAILDNPTVKEPSSTIQRDKVESGNAFINDCIIDEIGWFDNPEKVASQLRSGFWEETGIQPIIILKDYDSRFTSDAQKDSWAVDYYDNNIDIENAFLFVYFAEKDTDNDVGHMSYANGYQTSSVMDAEAIDIFWSKIDNYWYSNLSTDDMFVKTFNNTASTIMRVSTTGFDILKIVLIIVLIIVVAAIIFMAVKLKRKHDRERAEETERILKTPLDKL